jgi:hypothetical protein
MEMSDPAFCMETSIISLVASLANGNQKKYIENAVRHGPQKRTELAQVSRLVDCGVTLRYPPATLLAAQYSEGEFNCNEIAVCQLALGARSWPGNARASAIRKAQLEETPIRRRINTLPKGINAVVSDIIDLQHCAIDVDPSLTRVALAGNCSPVGDT